MKNIAERLERIKALLKRSPPHSVDDLIHELSWAVVAIEHIIDPPKEGLIGEQLLD